MKRHPELRYSNPTYFLGRLAGLVRCVKASGPVAGWRMWWSWGRTLADPGALDRHAAVWDALAEVDGMAGHKWLCRNQAMSVRKLRRDLYGPPEKEVEIKDMETKHEGPGDRRDEEMELRRARNKALLTTLLLLAAILGVLALGAWLASDHVKQGNEPAGRLLRP